MSPPAPPRVLVGMALDDASAIALRRADVLARALGAELHVLHVVPPEGWLDGLLARDSNERASAAAGELWEATDLTLSACEVALGRRFPREHVTVTKGPIVGSILSAADELGASFIILGGSGPHRERGTAGRVATKVLRAAHRAVLVARPPTTSGAIVAASDLSDEADPALAKGAELGARLHAEVTFLHNVDRIGTMIAVGAFGLPAFALADPLRDTLSRRGAKLRDIADHLDPEIDTMVLSCDSATQAILEIAQERDADLVVVGVHHRGALESFLGPGTAESVAVWTQRSVLAVPLSDNQPRA